MNFKNILLLISIISLIFVCVGGVAAHPGHGHEYIEEVSSSSDSPQSAPSHSGSYQQSHSSGGSFASHSYQSESSHGVAEKTHSSTGGKSAKSSVDSQNEVSDSGDMNVDEVNNSNTTDNSTAEEVVEETNSLFSTFNIVIYIVVFLTGLFGSICLMKLFSK